MSLATAGIHCTICQRLSGATEDCSIVRGTPAAPNALSPTRTEHCFQNWLVLSCRRKQAEDLGHRMRNTHTHKFIEMAA